MGSMWSKYLAHTIDMPHKFLLTRGNLGYLGIGLGTYNRLALKIHVLLTPPSWPK